MSNQITAKSVNDLLKQWKNIKNQPVIDDGKGSKVKLVVVVVVVVVVVSSS